MPVNKSRVPSEASLARLQALARLPVFFALDGKRAVLAGGSPAAAWKAELLSASGARVEVYATNVCDELLQLAVDPPRGAVVINRCAWSTENLANAADAVGAFADEVGVAVLSNATRAAGVLFHLVDRSPFCDFYLACIINLAPLLI